LGIGIGSREAFIVQSFACSAGTVSFSRIRRS
jgi:hypothetical protein